MELLKASQINHVNYLFDILGRSLFACDFSIMGAGKTWTTSVIAFEAGLPMFILGPRSSLGNWHKTAEAVGIEIVADITYQSLRSTRNHNPKHGYLDRHDYDNGSVKFAITPKFEALVEEGILLVLDECQFIKNNSDQTEAVRALVRAILDQGGRSRVIFLSGTPFDEGGKHDINFFRTIGFISHPNLYQVGKSGEFIPLGVGEFIDNLRAYAPEEVDELVLKYAPFNKRNVRLFIFEAFTEIVVPYFSSAMPSPPIDFRKDVGNGYYRFDREEDEKDLIAAVQRLSEAIAFNAHDDTVTFNFNNKGALTIALKAIEIAKIPLFIRLAIKSLTATEKGKVIFFLNYTETIDTLAEALQEYEPLIYDGRLRNQKEDDEVITAFQEDGYRLLLANTVKGGIAINLQDRHGDEPRHVYMSPNFSITQMHQASQRVYRSGLKSDVMIRVVYGDVETEEGPLLEARILRALSRKTENWKKILKQQAKEGVLFPGEYPEYHEGV